eukprot:Nk52_evm24s2531 gene=Nk52_evmTU24s2531
MMNETEPLVDYFAPGHIRSPIYSMVSLLGRYCGSLTMIAEHEEDNWKCLRGSNSRHVLDEEKGSGPEEFVVCGDFVYDSVVMKKAKRIINEAAQTSTDDVFEIYMRGRSGKSKVDAWKGQSRFKALTFVPAKVIDSHEYFYFIYPEDDDNSTVTAAWTVRIFSIGFYSGAPQYWKKEMELYMFNSMMAIV